jgi:hypothetical protein
MSWNIESFQEKLESEHTFPGIYMFKFIVPIDKKEEVLAILPDGDLSFKPSSKNTYVSITLKAKMEKSSEVLNIYTKAYKIEGILAL